MIFICLVGFFGKFYFIEVVQKFAERDATFVFSEETISEDEMKLPFITFCMTPLAKRSVLEEYNLSYGVLNEPNPEDREVLVGLKKTIKELFREVTFKLNVDFELTIKLLDFGFKTYEGKMEMGSNNYIKVCFQ